MSKHKQPGGIWTAQYAHCAVQCQDEGKSQFQSWMKVKVERSC